MSTEAAADLPDELLYRAAAVTEEGMRDKHSIQSSLFWISPETADMHSNVFLQTHFDSK